MDASLKGRHAEFSGIFNFATGPIYTLSLQHNIEQASKAVQ